MGKHDRGRFQHAGLERIRTNVLQHGIELLHDEVGWNFHDARNARSVLGREGGDYGHTVDVQPGECLEVGLNSGPPA